MKNQKRGRRPGGAIGREHILKAAITEFGNKGYQETTIRSIGEAAGVDAKLVHYYFGTKEELFSACISETFLNEGLAELLTSTPNTDEESLGTRYLLKVLSIMENPQLGPIYISIIRSLGTSEESRRVFHGFLNDIIFNTLVPALETDNPVLRLTLMGSQIIGLITTRYVLELGPLAELSKEEVAALVGPTLDHYLIDPYDMSSNKNH